MPAPHRVAPVVWLLACGLLLASLSPAAQPAASDIDIQRMLDEASAAYTVNDNARGRSLAESALTLAVQHERPLLEAEALLRLGKDDAWFRRYDAAFDKLERARGLFARHGNRQREAVVLTEMAWALTESSGDLTRARELLESARLTFREMDDAANLAIAGDRLIHATPKGPVRDALRANVLAEVRASGRVAVECSILHSWADELFNAGRYAEGYERATETVGCFEKTTDLGRMGRALVSLGRLERVHGQLDKALANYTRALALQEQVKDEAAAVQSLNALGTTFSMQGRHEEAKAHFEQALARARTLGRQDYITTLEGNLGGFYLNWGEYEQAAALLEHALREEKKPLFISVRKRQLASAYQELGRPDEAMRLVTDACDLAVQLGPEQVFHCVWTKAGIARRQGRLDQADRDLAHVRRILEEMRAKTLPVDLMRRGFGQMNQQLYGETIDLLAARNDGLGALGVSEEGRSRAFLDRLAARGDASAKTTTALATPAMATPATATPATVEDIKALAKRLQSTWLMYWVGNSHTIVWVVTPNGEVHWQRVAAPLAKIEALVAQSVPRGTSLDGLAAVALGSRAHLRPWRELYRLLIKPVAAHLPTSPGARLTIVPHGPLFRLSFAALPDEAGAYLIERYDLHYVPAAAVLQFTSAIPARGARPSLLVGDPTSAPSTTSSTNGSGTRDATLPELGWARREVTSIEKLLAGDSDTLVGAAATEAAVRQRLTGRRVIHFATHGVVHNDPTLASYLVMQGQGGADDSDGRLTVDEIDRFSLDADLVVLSACGTALGPISGDGVQGFTRAFLSAGVGSVIATTWSVADRTSYHVMEGFYREWIAGRDKTRALRESQLAMLRQLRKGGITLDGVVLHESPWLWAGFVLVGNPQ
jgi:CHAT domain-containing protein/tetratricopeptide (TPR) repeat protein